MRSRSTRSSAASAALLAVARHRGVVFGQYLYGEGAAVLNLLFILLFVLSLFYVRSVNREESA